jgi:ferredoxin
MEQEYKIDANSYEEVRFKTLQAILKSQFNIEVNDFGGMLQVKGNDKLIASVRIEESLDKPKIEADIFEDRGAKDNLSLAINQKKECKHKWIILDEKYKECQKCGECVPIREKSNNWKYDFRRKFIGRVHGDSEKYIGQLFDEIEQYISDILLTK